VAKLGAIHGLLVLLLALGVFLACGLFNLVSKDVAALLAYMADVIAVGYLGYRWKRINGVTFTFFGPREANAKLWKYALGMAVWTALAGLVVTFPTLISLGPWWPLMLFIIVPLSLFGGGANIAVNLVIGGWFYKHAT